MRISRSPVVGRSGFVLLVFFLLLVGIANSQRVSLSRTSLDFGNQAVGATSAPLNLILTNSDTSTPLTLKITASGDYAQTNDCNGQVPAKASCTLLVSFTPNTTGAINGVVTIHDDANNSPQLVRLSGTGVSPLVAFPLSLNFGTVAVGTSSASKRIAVTNQLTTTVNLTFSASGDYNAFPSASEGCGASLAAGASCGVSVNFKPTVNGAVHGTLSLTQNADNTLLLIDLAGSGSGGSTAQLHFSPASVSFGSVGIGKSSKKTITVTNNSAGAITISALTASRDYTVQGGSTSPCGGPLAAGNQCTLAVTFAPTGPGTVNGSVTVTNNGTLKKEIVNLSGAGFAPLTVNPASLTFASQHQGLTSAPQAVMVTNQLKGSINISSVVVSGDYVTVVSGGNPCGGSLAAGASCTIGVAFSPFARTGTIPGTLTITSNTIPSPQAVSLTGAATGELSRFAYVSNFGDNTLSEYTVDETTGQLRINGYVLAGQEPETVVVHPSNKFVYVVDLGGNAISGFTADANSGRLTPISGFPFSTARQAVSLTIVPSGKFAFVPSLMDDTISAYAVNPSTGAFTEVSGSPFPEGHSAAYATTDPSGKFLYITNGGDDSVSGYTINATTGALTAVPGSPFSSGSGPGPVAVDPSGKFSYVVNEIASTVSTYAVDAETGVLSMLASYPTGSLPGAVKVDHAGKFVYVGNIGSQDISAYSINSSTGALTPVAGSPFAAAGTSDIGFGLTIDETGQFLYACNGGADEVSTYAIDQVSGALTLLKTVAARNQPSFIAILNGSAPVRYTPKFAYVSNGGSNNISAYSVNNANGSLSEVSGSPFATPLAFAQASDPAGRFLYVVNVDSDNISAFTINSLTGALKPIKGSPFSGTGPESLAVDPSGRFLYAPGGENNISAFNINSSTGALTLVPGSPFPGLDYCFSVAIDPTGQFLYVTNQGSDTPSSWTISAYTIDPTTGALSPITGSPFPVSDRPLFIVADSTGQFVYLTTYSGNVRAFAINSSNGSLAELSGSPFPGQSSTGAVVDPTGRFVFVADGGANGLSAYTIDPSTGALTLVSGSPFAAGTAPSAMAMGPSGHFLYVENIGSGDVSAYAVNSSTGALTPISGSPFAAGERPIAITVTGTIH